MKLMSSSTARRRTAMAPLRSFGGPQMPSPVRRIAPKPRRCTEISPPNEIFPAALAETSFLFINSLQNSYFSSSSLLTEHGASRSRRRSHEFRPRRILNAFAQNGIDRGEITFFERPADYFLDGLELFRVARAPQRNANTRLIE